MLSDWYKDAIFYEVYVRGFYDSTGDGVGDFNGLTAKLDYLQWLGITCIWLLPFYDSPLRDGGYDISDYYSVLPDYGTVTDVKDFLSAAHAKGIRVIADLVINHTSDSHPWFQNARSSPDAPKRDWYVWSDSDQKYSQARIIFTDTERSNWTWDDQAGAFYWHRFFRHQPDLNYDNPEVRQAMLDVVSFWLDLGIDGLRVDAAPYLFEREETNCENLQETHQFLKTLRRFVDERYPDTLLLAEANQWPEDVVQYFGNGDEFHMGYNFPIMPRLFMALRQADRRPIVEILERTPPIPDSCQWGMFLRNHDELTLEIAQLIGVQQMGVDAGAYWSQTQNAVDLHDVWEGVVKSLVFGVAVSLVAVYEGYHAEPTPEGVGLATTRTVVISSVLVLLLNYLLTAAFLTTK